MKNRYFPIFGLLILISILLSGCLELPTLLPPTEISPPTGWNTVYFTDPTRPDASLFRGGPDTALATAIDRASLSVDMAIYDINLWSIRDSLVAAKRRGVTVRVVTESDNMDEPEINDLVGAGISVLGDRREGLMHNKFTVIDRQEVWTGSMNYTTTDAYLNNNNLLRLRSTQLAENYTREFEEMFIDDLFGPDKRPDTPNPVITINGVQVENYFSPDDNVADQIVGEINAAKQSIYFLAFSFTSDPLAEAIIARFQNGVTVRGVMEETQAESNIGGNYKQFISSGINVRLDGNPRNMHHKVIIIDKQTVITGSYNFSSSAENRNDENVVIIHDADLAAKYLAEFEKIYNLGHQ
jgi:phosphatidylserine/phosphatidylglycerophosphate/cardiolipin synthase-like enzyme